MAYFWCPEKADSGSWFLSRLSICEQWISLKQLRRGISRFNRCLLLVFRRQVWNSALLSLSSLHRTEHMHASKINCSMPWVTCILIRAGCIAYGSVLLMCAHANIVYDNWPYPHAGTGLPEMLHWNPRRTFLIPFQMLSNTVLARILAKYQCFQKKKCMILTFEHCYSQ